MVSGLAAVLSDPPRTSTILLLPELLSELDGWLRHRRLEPWRPQYLDYLETSRLEATQLRARLRRVRNALVHGNPVQTKVIETVTAFAAYLSDGALSEALDALHDGHDMLARLRQFDAERQHDLAPIASGTTPAALLRLRGL